MIYVYLEKSANEKQGDGVIYRHFTRDHFLHTPRGKCCLVRNGQTHNSRWNGNKSKQASSLIHHSNESKTTLVARRQTHARLCLFGKWTATRCCGGVDSVILWLAWWYQRPFQEPPKQLCWVIVNLHIFCPQRFIHLGTPKEITVISSYVLGCPLFLVFLFEFHKFKIFKFFIISCDIVKWIPTCKIKCY